MKILLSNDDGIDAPGLAALYEAVSNLGEVTVVAPDRERSGAGHSLTLHRPLRIHARGLRRYAIDGTPTDCVSLALKEIMKNDLPDVVLSGINSGPNLGDDITYSGTVSAALEAALLGLPAIALSLAVRNGETPNFAPAMDVAAHLLKKVVEQGLPRDVLLNVNVPNIEGLTINQYEITRMGKRHYGDIIEEKLDPRGRKYYWVGGDELGLDETPGTDCGAIHRGAVSVTPVRLDLTHDLFLETLRSKWSL